MDICIHPRRLKGKVAAMPSKSAAHRLLIAAALADGESRVGISAYGEDIAATITCLQAMGAEIKEEDGALLVRPGVAEGPVHLACGESGSTLRFLLPVAAARHGQVVAAGRGKLPQRPLGELIAQLQNHGVQVSADVLPLQTEGRLQPGCFCLPGHVSSQYVSGLLFALPLLPGDSEIHLTSPLESADYVTMTLQVLSRFSIKVETTAKGYRIPGGQTYQSPGEIAVEGDWSNGAFWLCAGALGGGLSVTGLLAESAQGDRRILEILARFGAKASGGQEGLSVCAGVARGAVVDVRAVPDLVPPLAVVAAMAPGESRIITAGRLRLKESDRLQSTCALLRALGGRCDVRGDALVIMGVEKLAGGAVDSAGDHRIAMAAAIASLGCQGDVMIRGAQAVNKSYPHFFEDFKALGGEFDVI